jgi:hypothetical protein
MAARVGVEHERARGLVVQETKHQMDNVTMGIG